MKIFSFDVETTGLDSGHNEIVQLSYLIEIDGRLIKEVNIFARPNFPERAHAKALEVMGKTLKDLNDAPNSSLEMYELLMKDLSSCCDRYNTEDKFVICGYNVSFDISFLQALFKDNGDNYFGAFFDLGKTLDPLPVVRMMNVLGSLSLPNCKLSTVCEHFGIELQAHDALSDIKATRELVKLLGDKIVFDKDDSER